MSHLEALFSPKNVAIIGASSDANKIGGRPLAFLKRSGFRGGIYPVNPGAQEVQGLRAHASLESIDAQVDHVIIAVAGKNVLGAVESCAHAGVRAIQIFSSGFAEGGGKGERERNQLLELTQRAGMRVLGPNSLGLFNTTNGFFGTFATALDGAWPDAGKIAVVTQSGAFGSYFFGMAQNRGLGFSSFVATGNEIDVAISDCIEHFAADPGTKVIVTAMEGCRDGRKLARAILAARAAGKPVLAMKVGVSATGATAAATHTGSIAGEDRVFDAVLKACGAWRANSLEQLVDAAYLASSETPPKSRDVLVVTTSGGIGVLIADAAEAAGLNMPGVDNTVVEAVQTIAPLAGGNNPVDTSAGIIGDVSQYARIAQLALAHREYGTAILFMAHIARNPGHWRQLQEPLYALRRQFPNVHFAAVLMASPLIRTELEAKGFTVFEDATRAVVAVAAVAPNVVSRPQIAFDAGDADLCLNTSIVTEAHAKRALGSMGIAFAPESFATGIASAIDAARQIGYPVVLKVVSPDILHKTEVGGVALGLGSDDELRAALVTMHARVAELAPAAKVDGYLVARQLPAGVEVIVGVHTDPMFGSVVSVGAGGVLTELINESSIRLAPVTPEEARSMITETRVARLLLGYRGQLPGDIDALCRQISLLSRIGSASRGTIAGLELNPVLVSSDGAYAVDALVQNTGASHEDS